MQTTDTPKPTGNEGQTREGLPPKICSAIRSVRFHAIRLLRQAADSLEERQALGETADILDIAAPREIELLADVLKFLEAGDMIEDEDLFAITALMEAKEIWPNAGGMARELAAQKPESPTNLNG